MTQMNSTRFAGVVPLSSTPRGARVRIARIDACPGVLSRLTAMGFVPGAELEVLNNGHPGPFVVLVRGTRVILGRGMAHKIRVFASSPDDLS